MAKFKSSAYTDNQIRFLQEAREKRGLSWPEIADEFNAEFEIPKPKTPNNLRGTYEYYKDMDLEDGDEFIATIRSNRSTRKRSSRVAKENRAILDHLDHMEEFEERMRDLLENVQFKIHKPLKIKKKAKKISRSVVAHLSDTHYGSQISKGEMAGLNQYNDTIAARRTALFFKQLGEYKLDHREDTELVLVLNGDLAAGIIHNQEDSVDLMTKQFAVVLDILAQGISYVAQRFAKVRVYCNAGNHMRFQHKQNKGRVTVKKWDSFATMSYIALKREFKARFDNVEFTIPESPFCTFDVQGHKVFATHGDTVFNVGVPSKTLKLDQIIGQINNINSSELKGAGPFNVFMVGHVHTPIITQLENGVTLIINGCMSGVDGFAQSIGVMGNNPTQQLVEMTKDYVGDMRIIKLKDADDDESLDKIIEPFTDLF